MKKRRASPLLFGLAVFAMAALNPAGTCAQDVLVFAEGAYTETDLAVYIYANTGAYTLCSFGVKLTYEPSEVTVASAVKNEAVWYLGAEPYMDPDTSTSGEVVIIGGKLDTLDPTAGVTGERVLLGIVNFARAGSTMPFSPTLGPLTYGKNVDYKNFVCTDKTVLDNNGVTFGSITVKERGDANADGIINFQDMLAVKYYTQYGGADHPYSDCNADGIINFQDMLCIKAKTQ